MLGERGEAVQPNKKPRTINKDKAVTNERNFPQIIEIALPANGLDVRVNRAMATFHRLHNVRTRFGRRRTERGQHHGRWCFSDPEIAEAFREQFGGEHISTVP